MSAVLAGGEAARIVLVVDTVSSILFDKPASEKAGRGRCRWYTFLSWGLLKFAGIGFVPRYSQYTQQRIAAGSARKFRHSTGSVLNSTGVENCMVEGCNNLWQFYPSCQSPWTVILAVNPIILYYLVTSALFSREKCMPSKMEVIIMTLCHENANHWHS